jgi:hypothetical protein
MSLTDSKRNKTYINIPDKNQRVAGSTFSISKYNKWKKLYESGGNMKKNLPKDITIGDLKKFMKLYKKRN